MSGQTEQGKPLDLQETPADNNRKGIVCGKCGGCQWRVTQTRPVRGAIRRYRVCRNCGRRRRTVEKAG